MWARRSRRSPAGPECRPDWWRITSATRTACWTRLSARWRAAWAIRCARACAQIAHAARRDPGGHRCQSRAGGIRPAHRHRVARVLGPGAARAEPEAGAVGLSAPHAVQPQKLAASRLVPRRGGAESRGHDRRDDRRRVAARGAFGLAGGRQRERAGPAHGIRRRPAERRARLARPTSAPRGPATPIAAARRGRSASRPSIPPPARCWAT